MSDCRNNPNWKRSVIKLNEYTKQKQLNNIKSYALNPNICSYCKENLPYEKRGNKYCNATCAGLNQPKKKHTQKTKDKIRKSVLKTGYKNIYYKSTRIYYNNCIQCKFLFIKPTNRLTCTDECKNKILSTTALKNSKLRGNKNKHAEWYISPIAGRVWTESSWERILAKDLDKHQIKWERPKGHFKWIDQTGKQRRYYPDFYLPDLDLYIDPKNPYLTKKDEYKINYVRDTHNINLLIISQVELLSVDYIYGARKTI